MRNKKGFTLVELVIVIAVIAILAGVMIGTFASVVKKAKESAKMQEMAAAKQEQTATDVLEKLNNGSWLGWEDFEEKLAKALADVNITGNGELTEASVKSAVAAALNEYAAAHPNTDKPNTGLTEAQVKYIVENALSGQLTAAQVKAIVSSAVSGTSTLTKAQVQTIIDTAVGKTLTASQVKNAVSEVIASEKLSKLTEADLEEKLEAILSRKNYSTLTEKEIDNIIKEALKNYSVKSAEVSSVKDIKEALKDEKVTNVVVSLAEDYKVIDSDKTEVKNDKGELLYKVALEITKDTVIDLDVHTLDLADARIVVEKGATLTIKGAGEVVSTKRAVVNSGTLVVEDGVISSPDLAIENAGILTINGGTFNSTITENYVVFAHSNSTTVINGGTFNGAIPVTTNGAQSRNTALVINGGTFTGDTDTEPLIYIPAGKVSIYGGTFNAKATALCITGGDVNIYGGTFTSTSKITTPNKYGFLKAEDITWAGYDGTRSANGATILINVARAGYEYKGVTIAKDVVVSGGDIVVCRPAGPATTDKTTVITDETTWSSVGVVVNK